MHLDNISRTTRFGNPQGGQGSGDNLVEWDGRFFPSPDGFRKKPPLGPMSFILTQKRSNHLLATVAYQFQSSKILQHCNGSAPKNLDAFLRKGFVSVGHISDGAL